MTIVHHPSDDTLEAYVRASLDEGRRVVVAAHVELCPSCQRVITALDELAGDTLVDLPVSSLAPDALEKALSRLAQNAPAQRSEERSKFDLPVSLRALDGYDLGPWRWIGPGVYHRTTSVPVADGARVFLLKAAPGTGLPHHTHTGTELTLILQGAFAHVGGRFGVGDFDEADGTVEHQPVVEPGQECICLVAMQGQLRLLGLLGRIMQPFVRM